MFLIASSACCRASISLQIDFGLFTIYKDLLAIKRYGNMVKYQNQTASGQVLSAIFFHSSQLSCHIRKPTISIGKNKGADQLCSNCTADQHLCFCSIDSTMLPLSEPEISSFELFTVAVQPGLYWSWSDTQIVNFLTQMLITLF